MITFTLTLASIFFFEEDLQTCCLLVVVRCFHNYTLLISTFCFYITLVVENLYSLMLGDFVNIVQLAVVPLLGGFPDRRGFTSRFLTGQYLSDISCCYFKGDGKFFLALCT